MKADEETIARSLQGNWREEHVFAVAQALERYDLLSGQIAQTEERIAATLSTLAQDAARAEQAHELHAAPTRAARERGVQVALQAVLGVDLTAIPTIGVETALTIASEVGPGPVALSHLRALLLVAHAGTGHAHQRWEVAQGAGGETSQSGGAGPAPRREHRAS